MIIYLRHPVHGTKVAITSMEVEYDEQNGWEQYDPTDLTAAETPAPANELDTKRRRGRPPVEAAN